MMSKLEQIVKRILDTELRSLLEDVRYRSASSKRCRRS